MEQAKRRGRAEVDFLRRRVGELESEKGEFEAILDHVGIGVGVIDERGRTTLANRLWRELIPGVIPSLGGGGDERWRTFDNQGTAVPPDDWPGARALRGQAVPGVNFLHRDEDGREVWVRVSAAPLRTSDGRVAQAVCTVQEVDSLMRTEEALRRSQELLTDELLAARQLQETSEQTAVHGDLAPLIERVLDAAVVIMRSDFASIQALDESGELRLLGIRGFSSADADFWEVVTLCSSTTCGEALRTGRRAVAANVETTDYIAGSEDLERFRQAGIRSCQTTPLRTRAGRVVGMLSTHWSEPHRPAAYDLASLDVLARQAADLIEHYQADEKQRRMATTLEEERRLVLRLSAPILRLKERLLLLPLIGVIDRERAEAIATRLLETVTGERASVVVIDASAVAEVDRSVGEWLLQTVRSVEFLGASVVLTGISARLSRAFLPFASDLGSVRIAGDLQEGLELGMARLR